MIHQLVTWSPLAAAVILATIVVLIAHRHRKARQTRQTGAMPAKYEELAQYNAEVARGISHSTEWKARMAQMQEEFDTWATGAGLR